MQISFGIVFTVIFLSYVAHLIYSISTLYTLPTCKNKEECLRPYLNTNPDFNLIIFTSTKKNPSNWETQHVFSLNKFNVYKAQEL